MRKGVQKVVLAAAIASVMTNTAYAATLEDFANTKGTELLTEASTEFLNDGLAEVPDDIIRYYNAAGGIMEFVDGVLELMPEANGLYYHQSSDIQVRVDDKTVYNQNICYPGIITHEIGHFIYAKTYSEWSDNAKEQLTNSQQYWQKYCRECKDEDETFATLYSWYRYSKGGGAINLKKDEIEMILEAEKLCGKIVQWVEDGNEYGPGVQFE